MERLKDRSQSRIQRKRNLEKKGGIGAYNWGNISEYNDGTSVSDQKIERHTRSIPREKFYEIKKQEE